MTPLIILYIIAILMNIFLHTSKLIIIKENKADSVNILIPWGLLLLEILTR